MLSLLSSSSSSSSSSTVPSILSSNLLIRLSLTRFDVICRTISIPCNAITLFRLDVGRAPALVAFFFVSTSFSFSTVAALIPTSALLTFVVSANFLAFAALIRLNLRAKELLFRVCPFLIGFSFSIFFVILGPFSASAFLSAGGGGGGTSLLVGAGGKFGGAKKPSAGGGGITLFRLDVGRAPASVAFFFVSTSFSFSTVAALIPTSALLTFVVSANFLAFAALIRLNLRAKELLFRVCPFLIGFSFSIFFVILGPFSASAFLSAGGGGGGTSLLVGAGACFRYSDICC